MLTDIRRFCPTTIDKEKYPHLSLTDRAWEMRCRGRQLIVLQDKPSGIPHLRIAPVEDTPIHDFEILQEIKDYVFGSDAEAIQVFPKSDNLINNSNTLHLWIISHKLPNLKSLYTYK